MNGRQVWRRFALHLDLRRLELVLEQRERVVDDLVQVDVAELVAAGAREVQQAVDDLRRRGRSAA